MPDYKMSATMAPTYSPPQGMDSQYGKLPPMLTPETIAELQAITPQLPAQDVQDYYDAWAKRKMLDAMMKAGTGDYSGAKISPWMYLKEAGPLSKKEWKQLRGNK